MKSFYRKRSVARCGCRSWAGPLLILFTVGSAALAAQEPPPIAPARPNAAVGELQELFDSYVMMQAQRQLKLSDAQLPQFILRLKALQTARRQAEHQRLRVLQELRRLTQPNNDKVDEAQIRDRLKMLDDLSTKSAGQIKQAQDNLDQILDVRQQARFRVLEEQIERNKVELLMRARQQANRGPR